MARDSADRMSRRIASSKPATLSKLSNGQPATQKRRAFIAYTVSQLLDKYSDPRAVLLEIASTDTLELARTIAGTEEDGTPATVTSHHIATALGERRLCAQAVLPYVAQKLPVQVDMRMSKAIHLNIVDDRQFTELQQLADEAAANPSDDVSITLIEAKPVDDMATKQGSGMGVAPPVGGAPQNELDDADSE